VDRRAKPVFDAVAQQRGPFGAHYARKIDIARASAVQRARIGVSKGAFCAYFDCHGVSDANCWGPMT
jgi:hypothetical protein